jgi:chemotaxis regulatin CheY-phosphate phosphatase CheZ
MPDNNIPNAESSLTEQSRKSLIKRWKDIFREELEAELRKELLKAIVNNDRKYLANLKAAVEAEKAAQRQELRKAGLESNRKPKQS